VCFLREISTKTFVLKKRTKDLKIRSLLCTYLKELLVLLNEWWKTGNVAKDRLQEYKREPFEE